MESNIPTIPYSELTIIREIGRGGFGTVFEGLWRGALPVAFNKFDVTSLEENSRIRHDFDNETKMMWNFESSRAVRLYGVCLDRGNCGMVLELMDRSLNSILHQMNIEVSEEQRWRWGIDIAQGLRDLHAMNVLHRDLKSHNVLIDHRGHAKLADFGLAKFRLATTTATNQRANSGTMRWRAPEWLAFRPPTPHPSMDMYSLGMVLWELHSRTNPYDFQPDDVIVKDEVMRGSREDIPDTCDSLWRELITGCWDADPAKRPSADDAYQRLCSSRPISHRSCVSMWQCDCQSSVTVPHCGFVLVPGSMEDWLKVLSLYQQCPVPGYDVSNVEVIVHPAMTDRFKACVQMLQRRKGNRRYIPQCCVAGHPEADLRRQLQEQLLRQAEPYVWEDCPDVKVLPVWHGTQRDKLHSILSAGYSAFGDTDDGYFGKGIYSTPAARYADMYGSRGVEHAEEAILLLNWAATYSSYPIVASDFSVLERRLVTRDIAAGVYDSHYVPVVSFDSSDESCMDYRPIDRSEVGCHRYEELVLMDVGQLLPRYVRGRWRSDSWS